MLRILSFAALCGAAAAACPPKNFSSISNFDLDTYISKRWYIQQMMETSYLPKSQFWCVYAEYNRLAKKSFWGYDLHVHNHAEEKNGAIHDSDSKGGPPGGIDAKIIDAKTGKLDVAPSFLPTIAAGPYWVIDYDEAEGYSLISGGAPTHDGDNGLCRTGTGTNSAGLWIFTREQKRNELLVQKARGIAKSQGFDLGVLGDVDQSNCTHSIRTNQDVMV
jgi:lipocalin